MDTYRGPLYDSADHGDALSGYDYSEDDVSREAPPSPVGQDERRMQVRAYNHWAGLLDNRNFPAVEDLDPDALPDFGPYSVLLDFTGGIENPAIQYLGDKLREECGAEGAIHELDDVPSRSLLSRITDHYMQILANQAPIGFEAEFVNQRELTVLYRGILLPFSSDDDTIDFIYGVINWKELADQQTTDELLLEIDQALSTAAPAEPQRREDELTDWADGPADFATTNDIDEDEDDNVLDLAAFDDAGDDARVAFPEPAFGSYDANDDVAEPVMLAEPAEKDMGLADWLASARELAQAAQGSEDRTRQALYAAIGRAWDFALAADAAPEEFTELVVDSGLTVQDRAPMTPVVKLVFGAEYDKTRLTEYASALSHAQRRGLGRGELASYLSQAPGGLKGVVAEERRLKREDSGKSIDPRETPRESLARKLRQLEPVALEALPADGNEFTLLVARRLPSGEVVVLGEMPEDLALLERAAKRLIG
jgi:hypothetical protein